jgi:hypothetical protein
MSDYGGLTWCQLRAMTAGDRPNQTDWTTWADDGSDDGLPAAVDVHTFGPRGTELPRGPDAPPVDPADCDRCQGLSGVPCWDHFRRGCFDDGE